MSQVHLPGSISQVFRSPHFETFITGGNKKYLHPAVRNILDHDPTKHHPEELAKTLYVFEPAIDVSENETSFKICADVPGFHKNNIQVLVTDEERGELVIKGDLVNLAESQQKEEEKVFGSYLIKERALMPEFERKLIMVDSTLIDWENINASIKHGQLTITLPKKDQPSKPPKESKTVTIVEE